MARSFATARFPAGRHRRHTSTCLALTTPETRHDQKYAFAVDVIIPVYGERSEALAATLSGCLRQTYPISRIYVVDDGSPSPVALPPPAEATGRVHTLRLAENQG